MDAGRQPLFVEGECPMADDRYDYYRSDDERDRDVYLDNRSGVGAPRGRGYRASYGPARGYGRAYGEDDHRERDRERGYSSYGERAEARSFRPEDYRSDYGRGSYSNESYGARAYQAGGYRTQPEVYGGAYGPSRIERDYDQAAFSSGFGFGHDLRGEARDYHRYEGEAQSGRRGFWDRAGDTVASWLGDDEARRRHEADVRASHRGKGPKGYKRSDDRIREDLNERLTDDLWLDASLVEVSVKDAEITLSGTVSSRDDRRYAERIAESISGAGHVQNNIRVSSDVGAPSDQGDVLARQAAGKH